MRAREALSSEEEREGGEAPAAQLSPTRAPARPGSRRGGRLREGCGVIQRPARRKRPEEEGETPVRAWAPGVARGRAVRVRGGGEEAAGDGRLGRPGPRSNGERAHKDSGGGAGSLRRQREHGAEPGAGQEAQGEMGLQR